MGFRVFWAELSEFSAQGLSFGLYTTDLSDCWQHLDPSCPTFLGIRRKEPKKGRTSKGQVDIIHQMWWEVCEFGKSSFDVVKRSGLW